MAHQTITRRHRRLRTWLVLGTALGGLSAVPVAAQSLPGKSDVVATTQNGFGPDVAKHGKELDVTLNAPNTVIDWNGFNIPENTKANFSKNFLLFSAAVLNRDVSGNPSQLLGQLTSDRNVAVWVFNANGIMVGPNASFSTGSLVLTTLAPDQTDFLNGGNSYRLIAPADSTAAITVANGAQIKVANGTRGLVMVAPKIDAYGQFEAVGQDVAFVTATDVTLTYQNGSPLSVTLNRGTPVPGRSQYIRGTVAGADALFALASQGTITDSLLQVDASVTTATVGTRGIVLSSGKPAAAVSGVTVAGTPDDTGGVGNLLVNGSLTTTDGDGGSDILAGAGGYASFNGALTTKRDVTIGAGGTALVANDVTAGRDYTVTGKGVTLGNGPAVQAAARSVHILSTDGDIVGHSGLTLQSGGGAGVALNTAGTTAGNIQFDAGTQIAAGANRLGGLVLGLRDASNTVNLGDVSAATLTSTIGSGAPTNGLALTSALRVGNVDLRGPLSLSAAGITAGTLASDSSIMLNSTGAINAAGINARGGWVALTGTGTTTINGAIFAGGRTSDISIARDGAISLQGVTAGRDARIGDGVVAESATIAGPVTAGHDYLVNAKTVTLGNGSALTQAANGEITITGGAGGITGKSGLTLIANADGGGTEALTLAIDPAAAGSHAGVLFDPNTALVVGTGQQSDIHIFTADPDAPIALGRISARNLLGAYGSNAYAPGLIRTGTVTVGDVLLNGDIQLSGTTVSTGALRSNGGQIAVDATAGALTVNGVVAANGALALRGGSVALAGATVSAGGSVDILARTGGISSAGALALSSSSNAATDFVRLQAAGPQGIVFGAGSSIVGGRGQALRVAIFNGTADAPLSLGNVTARSLGALGASNGDATAPAGRIVTNGSLAFGTLNLVDSFAAESVSGNLTIAGLTVAGANQGIDLRAPGGRLLVQQSLSASGDVTLVGGAALQLANVESNNGRASVTSGGALTLGSLSGLVGASAQGTSVTIDNVRGGAVALTSTAGDAQIGAIAGNSVAVGATGGSVRTGAIDAAGAISLIADQDVTAGGGLNAGGGALTVNAKGAAAVRFGAQASGDIAITGRTVALGGTQSATGAYRATATDGSLTGNAGLSIVSNADGTGSEAMTLAAAGGGISLDPTSLLQGGRDASSTVALTTDGGSVALGQVKASGLTISGTGAGASIRTGDLALGGDLALTAANGVTTGTIAVGPGGVAIDGGNGAATTGAITAGKTVSLKGSAVTFGDVQGGSLIATAAAGALLGGDVTVAGPATITAAGSTIDLGTVSTSSGDVSIGSAQRMTVGGIVSGGAASLSVTGPAGDLTVTHGVDAVGNVSLAATRDIHAPFIRSRTGDLTISAPNGEVGGLTAGSGISLAAGAGKAFTLTVGTDARLGNVSAGQIAITANSITAGTVDAGVGAVTLNAVLGDVTLSGGVTGGDVNLTGGKINVAGDIGASGALTATARDSLALSGASAGGAMALKATNALSTGPLVGDAAIDVTANGVTMDSVRAGGVVTVTGGTIDLGTVSTSRGDVSISSTQRMTVGGVVSGGGATLSVTGPAGDLTVTDGVDAVGNVSVAATRDIHAAFIRSRAGDLTISAPNGEVGGLAAGSGISLAAGAGRTFTLTVGTDARLGDVSAGQIAITANSISAGTIDAGNGAATLNALLGDLVLGGVTGGDVNLTGSKISVTGDIGASGALTATARDSLTLAGASAGGAMALKATNALSTGSLVGNAAIGLTGSDITMGSVRTGGAVTVTSGGNATLGVIDAAGATITANGRASLDAVTAGPSLVVTAADANLGGAIKAGSVTFTNNAGAAGSTALGDGTAGGGFALSTAEINLISADSLRVDAGAGKMEIGKLALGDAVGRTIELLGTGDISVTGALSSTGSRSIRIGGDASVDGPGAAKLDVIATSVGGGRLLLDNADLELRADRIAVGLASGFIDTLSDGEAGRAQAAALLGNGNSALYNAQLGGGFYDPGATTTVAARSLTVRFGDYALFQNTAIPGEFSGVNINAAGNTSSPSALQVRSYGSPAAASFAFFGTINGIGNASTALLGNPIVDITPALLPNSRINGCLAGSGAGCITTIVIQPTLQVFNWNSEDVFGISQDVAVPFAPIVGGNNEQLLTGLPELAPPPSVVPPPPAPAAAPAASAPSASGTRDK